MSIAKHVGTIAAATILFAAMSSKADDTKGSDRKGAGTGFDGQITVPGAFAPGLAFLLMGDDSCRFLYPFWMGMALDTRDVNERASGAETPGFPMACTRNGASLTCKVFKDGFTVAFNASVKTDNASQLVFGTAGGYIDTVVDLDKKTASFTQTAPSGKSKVCEMKYKRAPDAAEDVAKLDPPPASALPAKNRANGVSSGGDRLTCRSRNDSLAPKDPLTGRRVSVCSACTDNCYYVGEECKSGACVYTGNGIPGGSNDDGPSRRPSSSNDPPKKKKKGKGLGQSCKASSECRSDLSCKAVSAKRSTCR